MVWGVGLVLVVVYLTFRLTKTHTPLPLTMLFIHYALYKKYKDEGYNAFVLKGDKSNESF